MPGEGKEDFKEAEGKECLDDAAVIDVNELVFTPNHCAFEEPLHMELEFSTRRPVQRAVQTEQTVDARGVQRFVCVSADCLIEQYCASVPAHATGSGRALGDIFPR